MARWPRLSHRGVIRAVACRLPTFGCNNHRPSPAKHAASQRNPALLQCCWFPVIAGWICGPILISQLRTGAPSCVSDIVSRLVIIYSPVQWRNFQRSPWLFTVSLLNASARHSSIDSTSKKSLFFMPSVKISEAPSPLGYVGRIEMKPGDVSNMSADDRRSLS